MATKKKSSSVKTLIGEELALEKKTKTKTAREKALEKQISKKLGKPYKGKR